MCSSNMRGFLYLFKTRSTSYPESHIDRLLGPPVRSSSPFRPQSFNVYNLLQFPHSVINVRVILLSVDITVFIT